MDGDAVDESGTIVAHVPDVGSAIAEPDGHRADAPPGMVVRVEKNFAVVATGDGLLGITLIQAPGKKPLPMGDYARGARLEPGERFEDMR